MFLVLFMSVMLAGCPLGNTYILQSEELTQPSPAISTGRCQAEFLQSVRKIILDSLNLQVEPRVSVPGMSAIRNQWKTIFKSQFEPTLLTTSVENRTSSEQPSPANSTLLQCCKHSCQVFLTDLGWEKWIIYPESFTYIQCRGCDPQMNQSIVHCRDHPSSSQVSCCEPTGRDLTPFLYLDGTSNLVISSVPLTRECGCGPGNGLQDPKP